MNGTDTFLGIVQNGEFRRLWPSPITSATSRLTTIGMQAAMSPESGEIQLGVLEGKAIMVAGLDNGDWIFSADVIDQAGPILTAVVASLFGSD